MEIYFGVQCEARSNFLFSSKRLDNFPNSIREMSPPFSTGSGGFCLLVSGHLFCHTQPSGNSCNEPALSIARDSQRVLKYSLLHPGASFPDSGQFHFSCPFSVRLINFCPYFILSVHGSFCFMLMGFRTPHPQKRTPWQTAHFPLKESEKRQVQEGDADLSRLP